MPSEHLEDPVITDKQRRINTLVKKMGTLKGVTTVMKKQVKLFASTPLDIPAINARVAKYDKNFEDFEELMDELDELDPDGEYHALDERYNIQADYLDTLSETEKLKNPPVDPPPERPRVDDRETPERSLTGSTSTTGRIRAKLPDQKLPTFHGDYTTWVSFKTDFNSMIGTREDLTDSDKFGYLKSALKGEAARKIQMLSNTAQNYIRAWDILERTYSDTRVIVSRHLHQLLKLPQQEKEDAEGLANLVDSTRQHMESLNGLEIVVGDQLIVALLEQKISRTTADAWDDKQERSKLATLEYMLEFLTRRAARLSSRNKGKSGSAQDSKFRNKKENKENKESKEAKDSKVHSFNSTTGKTCELCNESHWTLYRCSKYKELPVEQRIKIAKQAELCLNCLNKHKGECRYGGCKMCGELHNSLLHTNSSANSRANTTANSRADTNSNSKGEGSQTALASQIPSSQVMTTAIVDALGPTNEPVRCRVLLDTGATANFITEELANKLKLPKKPCAIPIGTLSEMASFTKHVVTATIKSKHSGYKREYSFLTVSKITDLAPNTSFPRDSVKVPKNIHLADPEFYKPAPIDMLLGTGPTLALFCTGQVDLTQPEGPELILKKTRLGWIIGGSVQLRSQSKSIQCHVANPEFNLEKFWEIEETQNTKNYSLEEQRAVEHFKDHCERDEDGRYVLALPFNEKRDLLGDSYHAAEKRFKALERKFAKDPELFEEYSAIIDEYLELGYLEEVEDPSDTGYYIPHHAVVKKDSLKTKVRLVNDGSASTTSGVSLNDTLMVGPTIQKGILKLILNFRLHPVALSGDITKMFHQFKIRKEDRRFQRILWRKDGKLIVLEFTVVIFGLSSSPFQSVACLEQLGEDEKHRFPIAAKLLTESMYVDDFLKAFRNICEAKEARDELIQLLASAGITIKHWASNDPQLLEDLPPDQINQKLLLDDGSALKTLGVYWDTQSDCIKYTVKPVPLDKPITKRSILSEVSKIYDPLGLLGPVILTAKILIQKLWQANLSWDESVPSNIHTEWTEFCCQLNLLNEISFPRYIRQRDGEHLEVHGFCDASIVGYGACIYLRSSNAEGEVKTHLYCAKSRVAPLKTVSLPRLELCGALLLAKLYENIKDTIDLPIQKTIFWSDSTVTLHWIKKSPHLLKTFVANRVSEIQSNTQECEWRHVPGESNPADALSRGQMPANFIENESWTTGPTWLCQPEVSWPATKLTEPAEDPEEKRVIVMKTTLEEFCLLKKYHSVNKLKRIVAYLLRFKLSNKFKSSLQAEELIQAERVVLRLVQQSAFHQELHDLQKDGTLDHKSKLLTLNPFLDEEGIIRVGGRLKASEFPEEQKHPIVLPPEHHVTQLIIDHEHKEHAHAGVLATLYAIRRRYWILDGRNTVRRSLRKCVTCLRVRPPTVDYPMGDLPETRVTKARPFLNVGVDYCGPFMIKEKKHRNRGQVKTYVSVFVCLVTKAVHLELVSDLTTAGFIAALRRFIARRGMPQLIQSDNGTNFIGANNELKDIFATLQSEEHNEKVSQYLHEKRIKWRFIPPASPHFGGIWEAAVKSFKHHLRRLIGSTLFTFEEMNTLIIEIEGILNSRPLTPVSPDPNDLLVLTPGHFLIGDSLTNLPEEDLREVRENRLSNWQHIQQVRQHFWDRWYKEYLNELTVRNKWQSGQHSIKEGSIVLIREDNVPTMQWRLGNVIAVHPGADRVVRVATIKTASGIIKRNVRKLVPLPVTEADKIN